ncbi:MAG: tRNA 2-thiouridine(34) synthase MnmA [Bacteroidales bacterium]
MCKSVLVAISGGLDSTVTAILLKKQGYSVSGIHFALYNEDEKEKRENLYNLTEKIGVPLEIIDIKETFERTVIQYFTSEYQKGCTPCPCSFCNTNIKWDILHNYATQNDFNYIATGHYVRKTLHKSVPRIKQSKDKHKDQSYFLWGLSPEIISKSVTPLGDYLKSEVREIAKTNGFSNLASKPESMGICFLKGKNYREFIESTAYEPFKGPILLENGNYHGEHNGIYNFTIGQKKGICNLPKEYCVTKIDAASNSIVVGPWDNLFYNTIELKDCYFPSLPKGRHNNLRAMVRGFGKNPQEECTILINNDNSATVFLEDSAWAPMPGQPTAIYEEDVLIGGGYLYDYYNRNE